MSAEEAELAEVIGLVGDGLRAWGDAMAERSDTRIQALANLMGDVIAGKARSALQLATALVAAEQLCLCQCGSPLCKELGAGLLAVLRVPDPRGGRSAHAETKAAILAHVLIAVQRERAESAARGADVCASIPGVRRG
jgi:hypothetical protein